MGRSEVGLSAALWFMLAVVISAGCGSNSTGGATTERISVEQPLTGIVGITKLQFKGTGNDNDTPNNEYVVISASATREVTAFTLRDLADHVYTFPPYTAEANSTVTIYTGIGTNSQGTLYWGRGAAVWNNNADTAILRDSSGYTLSQLSY